MALDKAQKAIFHGKYGDKLFGLLIAAEDVIVTEGGEEKSLADVLASIASSALTQTDIDNRIKALVGELPADSEAANIVAHFTAEISGVSGKVDTLIGSDTGKSVRTIAGEVLANANNLTRQKVASKDAIDPSAEGADKIIYMVPKSTAKNGDKFDEYMVIDGAVEKVGDWEVNLGGYVKKVANPTAGNFAGLDADGNLIDTGKKPSDFVPAEAGKGLSTNDYDDAEKQAVANSKAVTDKLTNADVLKDISAEKVSAWDGKGTVYVSATQPANLKNGDIWLQTL